MCCNITTQTGPLGHKVTTIKARSDGPSLLVFGSIHGNEPCGTIAIERLIDKFEKKDIVLKCGAVTFIPECNRQAFSKNKRFIDVNLNRIFKVHDKPTLLEEEYANFLVSFIDQADYFLDIHSTSAGGDPFIFDDIGSPETQELALSLGFPYILQGWPDLYKDDKGHMDTLLYAVSQNVSGVLLECGQHDDPKSIDVAEQSILKALQFLGMLPMDDHCTNIKKSKRLHVYQVVYKNNDDFRLMRPLKPYQCVDGGKILATTSEGDVIAQCDSVIVLPNAHAEIGEESFYLARELAN